MPRFRFTDRDGVEVGSGVGVDVMGVSVGGTRVWVGTISVDVGELQEDSRNKKVMKFMKLLMLQIMWANKERRAGMLLPSKKHEFECAHATE